MALRRTHQGDKALPPFGTLHRQHQHLVQCPIIPLGLVPQALLQLLREDGLASRVDGTVAAATNQQLLNTISATAQISRITGAPPTLRISNGNPLTIPPASQRQAVSAHEQSSIALHLQLHVLEGLAATGLSGQKFGRSLGRHHRNRFCRPVARS